MSDKPRGNPGVAVVGGLGSVLVLGLAVVLYFSLVAGALERRDNARKKQAVKTAQLEKIERNIKKANRAIDELSAQFAKRKREFKQEQAQSERSKTSPAARRAALKRLVPPTSMLALVESAVQSDARKSGVELSLFENKKTVPSGLLVALVTNVRVSGSYGQVSQFLYQLTHSKRRIVTADNLLVVRGGARKSPFVKSDTQSERVVFQAELTFYARASKASGPPVNLNDSPVKNAKWMAIRGAFWEYSNLVEENQRDPFSSFMHIYVDDPVSSNDVAADGAAAEPAAGPEVSPSEGDSSTLRSKSLPSQKPAAGDTPSLKPAISVTTQYSVQSYEVLAVSLDAEPAFAVVLDPAGKGHRIGINSALGNAGGRVLQMTANSVVVKQPSSEKPIVLRLKD